MALPELLPYPTIPLVQQGINGVLWYQQIELDAIGTIAIYTPPSGFAKMTKCAIWIPGTCTLNPAGEAEITLSGVTNAWSLYVKEYLGTTSIALGGKMIDIPLPAYGQSFEVGEAIQASLDVNLSAGFFLVMAWGVTLP